MEKVGKRVGILVNLIPSIKSHVSLLKLCQARRVSTGLSRVYQEKKQEVSIIMTCIGFY